MNIIKKYLQVDFLIALVFRGSGVVLVFVLNIVLARMYGPEKSGYFYIFYNFLALVNSLVFMGFGYVIVHRITPLINQMQDEEKSKKGSILISLTVYILLFNAVLMTALLLLLRNKIAFYLCGMEELYQSVVTSSLSVLPCTAIFLFAELFKTLKKPNGSIICTNVIMNVIFILMIFINKEAKIEQIMVIYSTSAFVSFFIMLYWLIKEFKKYKMRLYSPARTLKLCLKDRAVYIIYIKENWMLAAISVSNVILAVFDTMVIGSILSSRDVAVYSIANKVVSFGSIILTTVNTVIGYKIADLSYEKDLIGLRNILIKYTRLMLPLGVLCYMFSVIFAFMIPTIFGNSYEPSIRLAIVLALGQFITIITGPCSYFMIMTGNTKKYRLIVVYTAGLTIILNVILINVLGIWGAALSNVLVLAFKNTLTFFYSKNSVSLKMHHFLMKGKGNYE